MEFATGAGSGVVSKIGEYLAEATINQVRYLCCFNTIVKDLQEEEAKLTMAKDDMMEKVERAKQNTQIIYREVEKWQSDANKILEEVEGLRKEIEDKKSYLSVWCPNWGCRYWLGRKATKKTIIMKRVVENGRIENVGQLAPLPDDSEFLPPKDFEFFQSSKFVFDQMIEALTNDQINLVGLYGMGGTGKTTLAKAVGEKVKEVKMFDKIIITVISQNPNFEDIQAHIAESLGLKLEEKTEEDRAKRLYTRFMGTDTETDKKQETEKKILVIVDDVWKSFDLKAKLGISFEDDRKGCKVLLTTRLEQVCIDMNCKERTQLNVLEEKEGLALLKRHARIVENSSELNAVAIQVARECGGLPLALVAIGCALNEKGIDDWKVMFQKLRKSKLEETPYTKVAGEGGIYATLKVSYDYLKGENTKQCFLLCSLFPEDHAIRLEVLVMYAMGLGWYEDADTIEDARSELRSTVSYLKASGLLLDAESPALLVGAGEEHVKMHDMVRDVALWIASKGENVFMSKVGMGQIEWLKEKDWERYTAISSINNIIEELSIGLVCPKLDILILGGESSKKRLKVSDECFKEMKPLKVLSLTFADLSLKSLQFLMNLKTLRLRDCNTRDISYIEKLKGLEILLFHDPPFDELPRELSELHNLRLFYSNKFVRIPSNVLQICSKLEELYTLDRYERRKVEETSMATLFEVTSLSRLSTLHFNIYATCLPKDLDFPKLQRYVIRVNTHRHTISYQRALEISNIEAVSLIAFKALYETLEYLRLENVRGCQNVLPSIDQGVFNELKEADISACDMLQEVFQLEGLCHTRKEVLPRLAKLALARLPMLRHIWKGTIHLVNLRSLTYLCVDSCKLLKHIFPISIVRNLVGLEELIIRNAHQLKQVFYLDHAWEENIAEHDGEDIELPKLRILRLERLESLTSFLPKNYHSKWPMLEELHITKCSSLTTSSISEVVKMQDLKEKLRVLKIGCCHNQLCDGLTLSCLRHDFLPLAPSLRLLEELSIEDCGKMEYIIEDNEEYHPQPRCFSNLRVITVKRCAKLKYLFPIRITQHLQQLKSLTVEGCNQLEKVFERKDGANVINHKESILSQLQNLSLNELPSLTNFGPVGYHSILKLNKLSMHRCNRVFAGGLYFRGTLIVFFGLQRELRSLEEAEGLCKGLSLQNLSELCFIKSHSLKYIFSSNLARYLLQLKELYVINCEELEQIIVEDEKDHIQTPFFPSLNIIDVRGCNKLKHLFPVSIATGLQQLNLINVQGCDQLQRVFGHKNGSDVMNGKEIDLPQLKYLTLYKLRNLINFGPVGYQFILKLRSVYITGCDQMCAGDLSYQYPVTVIYGLQYELRSLEEAKSLCIIKSYNLKYIFSFNLARDLLQLKELYIINCEELEKIIVEDHIQTPFFPNLRKIDVRGSNKLNHLFPITIAAGLQQLESICIQGCDQLQKVFGQKNGADDMNDREIMLPQLKKLLFKALPNLTNFGPAGYHFQMQLKSLEMEGCSEQMWKNYLGDGEDISIKSFEVSKVHYEREHVTVNFERDGGCEFTISGVNESDLRCVGHRLGLGLCRGLTLTLTLHNLSTLEIHECHEMRHILSSNLARNLLQLEKLHISNCEELEQIIIEDGEEDHIQTPFVPNLYGIDIIGCNKLKHMFPVTMVRGLRKLKRIDVKGCDQLEEVFVDGDDVLDDKGVVSELEFLRLEKLPRLTNFCSTGYHCIFPSLHWLSVKECPKISTRFSIEEDKNVHAEGKPPNEGGNDDDHPTMDLDCSSRFALAENLPPYMGKMMSKGSPSSRKPNAEEP